MVCMTYKPYSYVQCMHISTQFMQTNLPTVRAYIAMGSYACISNACMDIKEFYGHATMQISCMHDKNSDKYPTYIYS